MDISAYQHMSIRMSTRGKRPLRNLTPSDKVRAIQRIHNGETKASVSRDIGVPESTLRGWCKNEQKLRFMCRQLRTGNQLSPIPGMENPPEKRPRFENHTQAPKYPATSSFDEYGYNRLSLNGLSFSSTDSSTILEKITLNEMMKRHMMSADSDAKPQLDRITAQLSGIVGGPIPIVTDYSAQVGMMQNLNLLSLLSPNLTAKSNLTTNDNDPVDDIKNRAILRITDEVKDNTKSNGNDNINTINKINHQNTSASLSVKNWAKDPAEKNLPSFSHPNNRNSGKTRNSNDPNNNNVKVNSSSFPLDASVDVLNFPPPLPLGVLQIPNISNTCNSESSNNALLEWCKVFNASIQFLALATATAALQPNGYMTNTVQKEDNILYKELTKTANFFDSSNNPTTFTSSDLSNDSYFDSEPEDLSVRSTATSKLSSPDNSRSESPVKSNTSGSPLPSDVEY